MTRKQQKEYIRSYRSEKNACASNSFCQTIFGDYLEERSIFDRKA